MQRSKQAIGRFAHLLEFEAPVNSEPKHENTIPGRAFDFRSSQASDPKPLWPEVTDIPQSRFTAGAWTAGLKIGRREEFEWA